MCCYPGDRWHVDLGEVAEEPGEAGCHHQPADAALRTLPGSNQSAADEGPADGQVWDPQNRLAPADANPLGGRSERDAGQCDQAESQRCRVQLTSAASASPESALFGMKPRAGTVWTRGP